MRRILALANQKGGVGKTTTALNLGFALAAQNKKVLLVDLDPQASLSQALGQQPEESLADVLGDSRPGKIPLEKIIKTITDNLDLAPADLSLSNSELGLTARLGRETALKKTLAAITGYDLVIVDCPPSLGLLAINALVAADAVIAPLIPDHLGRRGLALFWSSLEAIKELNPALEFLGCVLFQYDRRQVLHQETMKELQAENIPVLAIIPRRAEAARSAGSGRPSEHLAGEYTELAEKVISWLKN